MLDEEDIYIMVVVEAVGKRGEVCMGMAARGRGVVGVRRACRRRLSHEGGEEASCDAERKIDMGLGVYVYWLGDSSG